MEQGSNVTYMVLPRARSPARAMACVLGMRTTAGFGPPAGNDFAGRLVHDHGADGGIGRSGAEHAARKTERDAHVAHVGLRPLHRSRGCLHRRSVLSALGFGLARRAGRGL